MKGARRISSAARDLRDVVRAFKLEGLKQRVTYEARRRLGLLKSTLPVRAPAELRFEPSLDLAGVRSFFERHPASAEEAIERAERIVAGWYPYFVAGWWEAGWPPAWHADVRTGTIWPSDRHWTDALKAESSDIKWVWEPSRFAFVFAFVRAYAATGEARWVEAFWEGVDSWTRANPPFDGVNWGCGQESSLRAFAVELGLLVFAGHDATTPERLCCAIELLLNTGRRVAATLDYALSQRNNHALSELVGLWTVAALLPDWPEAAAWRRLAEERLPGALTDQFEPDGAYIQESTNYHRLALHDLLWLTFVGRVTGVAVPGGVAAALEASLYFLADLTDDASGRVPNYGANDGALLLPLSVCSSRDFRPLIQHLSGVVRGRPALEPGPWDEEATWVLGADAPEPGNPLRLPTSALRSTTSGYVTSRQSESLVFTRVKPPSSHRPSQADALHVDVWLKGRNVAADLGSYSYAESRWHEALSSTRLHNTCSVDDRSQLKRLRRFLWTHWTVSKVRWMGQRGDRHVLLLCGFADFERRCRHWRLIVHDSASLQVLDSVECDRSRLIRLHWNLAGGDWAQEGEAFVQSDVRVRVGAPTNAERRVVRGRAESGHDLPMGWVSPTYGVKQPCLAVEVTVEEQRGQFETHFTWGASHTIDGDALLATWRAGEYLTCARTAVRGAA